MTLNLFLLQNIGNYAFGYDEGHSTGGTFRKESGDAYGNKFGSYGLRDADGRLRIVNYVADAGGFRADIKTNEPGVEPKDPANTAINKSGFIAAPSVAAVSYVAPAAIARAAPITYAAHPISYAAHPIPYAAHPIAYANTFPFAGHYGYYHL